MKQPFDLILFFALGRSQNLKTNTGIIDCWERQRRWSSSRTCIMTPMPWTTDSTEIAKLIADISDPLTTRIVGTGYSWGAGWFCMRLAQELGKLNRTVHGLALCDPVYRDPNPLLIGLSLDNQLMAPEILVPPNVGRVVWTRQYNDKPRAHNLAVTHGSATQIEPATVIADGRHATMDECPVFHDLADKLIETYTEGLA